MRENETWEEVQNVANARWKQIENPKWEDITLVSKELVLTYSEVLEALGYKDYFDFQEKQK